MGVTAAAGGGEPGRPAGSPTSGTSALEKNNSGILFNRQTGSSQICTVPMGRWMACNSAPRQSDDPARSIGPAMPVVTLLIGAVRCSSLASAAPIERKSAPEKGSGTGIRTRKKAKDASNLYVLDGTWHARRTAEDREMHGHGRLLALSSSLCTLN